jgi:hypothetical protein
MTFPMAFTTADSMLWTIRPLSPVARPCTAGCLLVSE